MNSVCYLRAHNGIEVIRIAPNAISLQENDFSHAEWSLGPASLPDGAVARVHQFCASQGVALPDWSVVAERRF